MDRIGQIYQVLELHRISKINHSSTHRQVICKEGGDVFQVFNWEKCFFGMKLLQRAV
jgi:hypothetical protein